MAEEGGPVFVGGRQIVDQRDALSTVSIDMRQPLPDVQILRAVGYDREGGVDDVDAPAPAEGARHDPRDDRQLRRKVTGRKWRPEAGIMLAGRRERRVDGGRPQRIGIAREVVDRGERLFLPTDEVDTADVGHGGVSTPVADLVNRRGPDRDTISAHPLEDHESTQTRPVSSTGRGVATFAKVGRCSCDRVR